MKPIRLVCIACLLLFPVAPASAIDVIAGGTGFANTSGEQKWLMFKERVEQESGGELNVRAMIYGELGPEDALVAGIRRGRIQISNWSGLATSTVVPEASLLYAPFLFDSHEEADFIFDNYLRDIYTRLLAEKDITFISWDEIGFNQIYGTKPILVPDDASGVRFRVATSVAARLFAESIGADVIPLGFTDIIVGLQTGLINAGENAIVMYARTGISEDARNLTLTNHSFGTSIIVADAKWLKRQSPKNRQIIETSWPDLATSRKLVRDEWQSDLDRAQEMGFMVHTITPEQREAWKAKTASIGQALVDSIGGESQAIWDTIQEAKVAFKEQAEAGSNEAAR